MACTCAHKNGKSCKITTKIRSQKARSAFKGAVFTCKKVKCPGARAPRVKTTSHLIGSIWKLETSNHRCIEGYELTFCHNGNFSNYKSLQFFSYYPILLVHFYVFLANIKTVYSTKEILSVIEPDSEKLWRLSRGCGVRHLQWTVTPRGQAVRS